jgi:hypothetical protein
VRWLWIAVTIALVGAYQAWSTRPLKHTPGEVVSTEPLQKAIGASAPRFRKQDAEIVARARFEMEAMVLARERYRFDRMAKLAPVDLAFGWGPMSDSSVLGQLSITQSNRFYFWTTAKFPVPRKTIETHSANMHLIPATAEIEQKIDSARVGQVVRLSGYLVDVTAADGWSMRTSLTRDDTGAGACEVIWVESFD